MNSTQRFEAEIDPSQFQHWQHLCSQLPHGISQPGIRTTLQTPEEVIECSQQITEIATRLDEYETKKAEIGQAMDILKKAISQLQDSLLGLMEQFDVPALETRHGTIKNEKTVKNNKPSTNEILGCVSARLIAAGFRPKELSVADFIEQVQQDAQTGVSHSRKLKFVPREKKNKIEGLLQAYISERDEMNMD